MDAAEIERRKALCRAAHPTKWNAESRAENAAFIAAHDPTTLLALYEELEALREVAEATKEDHSGAAAYCYCTAVRERRPCRTCDALARLAVVREGKP